MRDTITDFKSNLESRFNYAKELSNQHYDSYGDMGLWESKQMDARDAFDLKHRSSKRLK
jgi:hypothetical protein